MSETKCVRGNVPKRFTQTLGRNCTESRTTIARSCQTNRIGTAMGAPRTVARRRNPSVTAASPRQGRPGEEAWHLWSRGPLRQSAAR